MLLSNEAPAMMLRAAWSRSAVVSTTTGGLYTATADCALNEVCVLAVSATLAATPAIWGPPEQIELDPAELGRLRDWVVTLVEASYQSCGYRRVKNPRIWSMHDINVLTDFAARS